jgi:hypothetical protein
MKIKLIGMITLLVTSAGLSAQEASNFQVPRTEWGQPDLQGVWNFSTEVPLQRPERFGTREFLNDAEREEIAARVAAAAELEPNEPDPDAANRGAPGTDERFIYGYDQFWYEGGSLGEASRTSQIYYPENGRLPARLEGVEVSGSGFLQDTQGTRPVRMGVGGIGKDGPEDRGTSERCLVGLNEMPPLQPSRYNNNVQIFQNRDHVVILSEMNHNARIVPLDNRPPLTDDIRFWTGDTRGDWEGDTLVVVSKNFNGLTHSFGSAGTSRDKVLTERFTRSSDYAITYDWTLEDPSTFTDKISGVLALNKTSGLLYEYACQEGNYGLMNILRGERAAEARLEEEI